MRIIIDYYYGISKLYNIQRTLRTRTKIRRNKTIDDDLNQGKEAEIG